MADVVFQGAADFGSIEKAFQSMAKENLRLLQQVQSLATANNQAASADRAAKQQQAAMSREASAIMERAKGPVDRYRESLGKLRDHMTANRISAEAYRQEKTRLLGTLQRETQAMSAQQTSDQQLASVRKSAAGDDAAAKQRAAALAREAIALTQRHQSAEERYRQQLGRVRDMRNQNLITEQAYNAEKRRLLQNLQRETAAANQAGAAHQSGRTALQGQSTELAKGKGLISDQVTALGGMLTGYVSIQAAISAINRELEHKATLEKKSAGTERTLEAALAEAMPNIGIEDRGRFREMVRDESLRLGVDQTDYANVSGVAISAGAGDLDRASQILDDLFQLSAGDAEGAKALGQAGLDFTSLAGNDNIRGAIGQMAAAMQVSRATNMTEYAGNIAPAIAAATAGGERMDGLSVEQALEVAGVLNNIMKDTTGQVTATAETQLIAKMQSFVPELGQREKLTAELEAERANLGDMKPGSKQAVRQQEKIVQIETQLKDESLSSVSAETIAAFNAVRDFDSKKEMFRENKALADQIVETIKEGNLKNAMREFLVGTDRAKQEETRQRDAIPSMDNALPNFESLMKSVTEETAVLRAERKSIAAQQFKETEGSRSVAGQAREIMERFFSGSDQTGLDASKTFFAKRTFDSQVQLGMNPIDAAQQAIRETIEYDSGFKSLNMLPEDVAEGRRQIQILEELRDAVNAQNALERVKPAELPAVQGRAVNQVDRPLEQRAAVQVLQPPAKAVDLNAVERVPGKNVDGRGIAEAVARPAVTIPQRSVLPPVDMSETNGLLREMTTLLQKQSQPSSQPSATAAASRVLAGRSQ